MSGHQVLDRERLALAFSEVERVRQALPERALTFLAQEVVKRVAENLNIAGQRASVLDIDMLCDALLSTDDGTAIAMIEQAQKRGATFDDICQFYLAEASRRLGQRWDNDDLSFYRVTIAAGRIYALLRILRMQRPSHITDLRRSAIFAAVPGDTHTLGITIAADMARDRGWDIELLVGYSHDELVEILGRRDTNLIGLSASAMTSLPSLVRLIVALRISNPTAKIMVCGQIAARNLNLQGLMAADAAAVDFDQAFDHMERLVRQM
jgi:methanogenic corrinoid protein MtbC1